MNIIIGIDFGTLSCRTAYNIGELPIIIPTRFSEGYFPFALTLPRSNYSSGIIPTKSKDLLEFSGIKQKLGIEETFHLDGEKYRTIDFASNIFSTVKDDAMEFIGEDVCGAVITVPSCFSERQREAIRMAAEEGGFGIVRLLDESTAAAISLGAKDDKKRTSLIYSIGGGVSTVSAIKINRNSPQALWHEGDRTLGGNLFDSLIISCFIDKLKHYTKGLEHPYNTIKKLKLLASRIKVELSEKDKVEFDVNPSELSAIGDEKSNLKDIRVTITRNEFEDLLLPYLNKTISFVKSTIQRSDLTHEEIDSIYLIGGSTRIPLVDKLMREVFDINIIKVSDELIVNGAAMYGSQISKSMQEESLQAHNKNKTDSPIVDAETPKGRKPLQGSGKKSTLLEDFTHSLIASQELLNSKENDKAIRILGEVSCALQEFIVQLCSEKGKAFFDDNLFDQAIIYFKQVYNYYKDNQKTRIIGYDRIIDRYHVACNREVTRLSECGNYNEAIEIIKTGIELNPDCDHCKKVKKAIESAIKNQRSSRRLHPGKTKKKKRK